jgi:predicted peroxiredoxin
VTPFEKKSFSKEGLFEKQGFSKGTPPKGHEPGKEMREMSEKKFILYVQTSDAPERQYSPLVLAQTAKAMELDAKVYYLGMGLKVLRPGVAEAIKMGSFPTLKEMMDKAIQMGVELYACEASKQMLGWETVTLIPGVKIVGAGTLNDLALDADAAMWF